MIRRNLLAAAAVGLFAFTAAAGSASAQRAAVSSSEVNGTFRMNFRGAYRKFYNTIDVLALGKGKIRVALDLTYPYRLKNGEEMANMGSLDAVADIKGDRATWTSEDGLCTITFHFVRPGLLKVEQSGSDGECGFGHNVSAAGTYRKVSSKKPKFQ
jgi:hypothetical protein